MVKIATINININIFCNMLLKMPNKVAYLITYISYNCVNNNKGMIDESLLKEFILNEVSEYIINNSFSTKFELIDDIIKFWERYRGYNVWDAYYVKDNIWINIKPSDEDILLNIYEMTKSIEMLEKSEFKEDENILYLEESCLSETLEIVNISQTIDDLSEISNSSNLFEENIIIDEANEIYWNTIEIDWNTISHQEQEEQKQEEQ